MKRFIFALLFAVSLFAAAGEVDTITSQFLAIKEAQRALIFDPAHNANSKDGHILVCLPQFETGAVRKLCTDSKGHNAWMDMLDVRIAGYRLVSWEYRITGGSAGMSYNTLIMYFQIVHVDKK